MAPYRLDPKANFWSKVDTTGDCWLWLAGTDRDGYGKFQFTPSPMERQRHVRAHRFAWTLAVGEIPMGMVIAHHCDNPPCVRPDHLWLATPRQNNDDKVDKGRHAKVWGTPLANLRKTKCKRGHPLKGTNLWIDPKRGYRRCRTCANATARRYYWRRKEVMQDGR